MQCANVASAVLFFPGNRSIGSRWQGWSRLETVKHPCPRRGLFKMSGTNGHGEALHDLAAEGTSR